MEGLKNKDKMFIIANASGQAQGQRMKGIRCIQAGAMVLASHLELKG